MERLALIAVLTLAGCPAPRAPARPGHELHFCLREGEGHNCLHRDERVTAHLHARSGTRARILIAFPAENSGIALWAEAPGARARRSSSRSRSIASPATASTACVSA